MVRTRLNIGCRYSTPVRERPLHPTRSHFTPEPSQTQAPVTPATEPEQRAGGSLTKPWPLPRHHRRDRLLPNVLPLVQHRTSPWRDRDAHPGRRASQSNPERAGAARADPSSRLDPSSRTLRSRDPTTGSPSPSRLDQPTCDTHNRRNCSVNRNRHCLKVVDRFRKWTGAAVPLSTGRRQVSSKRLTRPAGLGFRWARRWRCSGRGIGARGRGRGFRLDTRGPGPWP